MLKTVSSITNAIGALNYKGTWNASTNTPTLTSSVGTKGDYYVVSTAGTTNLNGQTLWGVGDWAVFNGAVWQRVEAGDTGNFTTLQADAFQLKSPGVITEAGTTRTLSATDNGKVIYCTSGSAITIDTATGLGAGFSCLVIQGGAGQITFNQAVSTTLVSYASLVKTAGQYAAASVVCPVADTFLLTGNLGT
jgi:hypothetical protein